MILKHWTNFEDKLEYNIWEESEISYGFPHYAGADFDSGKKQPQTSLLLEFCELSRENEIVQDIIHVSGDYIISCCNDQMSTAA
mgnify:FL=1